MSKAANKTAMIKTTAISKAKAVSKDNVQTRKAKAATAAARKTRMKIGMTKMTNGKADLAARAREPNPTRKAKAAAAAARKARVNNAQDRWMMINAIPASAINPTLEAGATQAVQEDNTNY